MPAEGAAPAWHAINEISVLQKLIPMHRKDAGATRGSPPRGRLGLNAF
jgi:hypothetical protein